MISSQEAFTCFLFSSVQSPPFYSPPRPAAAGNISFCSHPLLEDFQKTNLAGAYVCFVKCQLFY
jgi:hypothetical protein